MKSFDSQNSYWLCTVTSGKHTNNSRWNFSWLYWHCGWGSMEHGRKHRAHQVLVKITASASKLAPRPSTAGVQPTIMEPTASTLTVSSVLWDHVPTIPAWTVLCAFSWPRLWTLASTHAYVCRGYVGTNCQTYIGSQATCSHNNGNCASGSTCAVDTTTNTVKCICPPLYTGTYCDQFLNACFLNG